MGGLGAIRENLTGAWQLMLGRPEGLNRLDTSLEGFWRSFAAVILIVPFALLASLSQGVIATDAGVTVEPLSGSGLTLQGITILADWFAFPIFFAALAKPFGLGSRYVPFIVARNWASVIMSAMVGAVHVLHLVGILSGLLTPFVLIIVFAVTLRFAYVIARIALAVSMGMALPVVMLDLLISLTLWSAFDRVF